MCVSPAATVLGGGQALSTEKKREESEGELARYVGPAPSFLPFLLFFSFLFFFFKHGYRMRFGLFFFFVTGGVLCMVDFGEGGESGVVSAVRLVIPAP